MVATAMTTEMTPRDDCPKKKRRILLHTSWIGLNEFGDGNGADDGAHTLLMQVHDLAMIMKTSAND